jgi:hypothetical protein
METIVAENLKRTRELFPNILEENPVIPEWYVKISHSQKLKLSVRINDNYKNILQLPSHIAAAYERKSEKDEKAEESSEIKDMVSEITTKQSLPAQKSMVVHQKPAEFNLETNSSLIRIKEGRKIAKPDWHAPWKLKSVFLTSYKGY